MAISVDIADRLYDYTDEEKVADAIAQYQDSTGLSDAAIIHIWQSEMDPARAELEHLIFEAIDTNGSVKRAQEHVPASIVLLTDAA